MESLKVCYLGRDGQQVCATILYRKSDIFHANQLVVNNLANAERCNQNLTEFSESWQYVKDHLAGVCRRKLLLAILGKESSSANTSGDCCNVCSATNRNNIDFKDELNVLLSALSQLGCKNEVKIAEWIRGSNIA